MGPAGQTAAPGASEAREAREAREVWSVVLVSLAASRCSIPFSLAPDHS